MKKRILLAEDDKQISLAYIIGLKKAGYEVKHVENGADIIAIIKLFNPDIILLDLIMPIRNGFDILHDMKNEDLDIPVIILSNIYEENYIQDAKIYRPVDYMVKSNTSLELILNRVNKELNK